MYIDAMCVVKYAGKRQFTDDKTDKAAKIAELRKMTIRVFFDDSQMKKERYAV